MESQGDWQWYTQWVWREWWTFFGMFEAWVQWKCHAPLSLRPTTRGWNRQPWPGSLEWHGTLWVLRFNSSDERGDSQLTYATKVTGGSGSGIFDLFWGGRYLRHHSISNTISELSDLFGIMSKTIRKRDSADFLRSLLYRPETRFILYDCIGV